MLISIWIRPSKTGLSSHEKATAKQILVEKIVQSFLDAQHSVGLTALSMTDQQSLQQRSREDDRGARRQPHEA